MPNNCLKCGGTGILATGEHCDCGAENIPVILPQCTDIPEQYYSVSFNKEFVPSLSGKLDYGRTLTSIKDDILSEYKLKKNVLICAPPNSGKTIFAYTIIGSLYSKGITTPTLIDLMELRSIFTERYNTDFVKILEYSTSPVVIVKIPMDIPTRFVETMSMLIERRVRNGVGTLFLFSGSLSDLEAVDTFNKLSNLKGDGYYNSIEVLNWFKVRKVDS